MKSILVTGGAGFIGSHTCLVLLEKGYKVFVIDSFENSSPKSLEKVLKILHQKNNLKNNLEVFEGNLCDKKFLDQVFSSIHKYNHKIDGVIHFAGVKSTYESTINPLFYWKTNVLGTINLLEIMYKYSCNNLVFSSSATIYNQNKNLKIKEKFELAPVNPYGNTKFALEIFLNDLFKSPRNNLSLASLRYFNPIGAHESGLIGEDPKNTPNNIFPIITNTAIGFQKELEIFGKDWPTNDGTPIRDYIHVMDLAESHIKVLEYLQSKTKSFLTINIGTGKGTSVLELINIFEKVNKKKVPYIFSNRRIGDHGYVVADNSFLTSKFKIYPKRSLEEMCRDGWKWKKLNPHGY